MTFSPAEAREHPLLTEADMIARIEELLAPAINPGQLWILFLDELRRQLPLMVPLEGLPAQPDPTDGGMLAGMIGLTAENAGSDTVDSVIYVLERLGTDGVTAADRRWAAVLTDAGAAAGVSVAGIFLMSPNRIRPVSART